MARIPVYAYVALGSNLGDRAAHLDAGVAALRETPDIHSVRGSRYHETQPVGGPPQGPYLNGAVELVTTLAPEALLEVLHGIEASRGRERGPLRDAPRTLDLDLLLFGDAVIDRPGLQVPHPRMHERFFVLAPLVEIASDAWHPVLGKTAAELLAFAPSPEAAVRAAGLAWRS